MVVIGTTKHSTPCIWTNIGKGIEGLTKYGYNVIMYDHSDFLAKRLQPTTDEVIFIFEAGFGQTEHTGYNLADLKSLWPNSKFIALGADISVWKFIHNRDQLDFKYVDLLLDTDSRTADYYSKQGIKTKLWTWTISQWLIEKINEYTVSEYENRTYDFISVLHAATLNVGYRKRLIDFINNNNMKFTNGGGNSHEDNDLDRLFSYYNNSKIALGVSNLGVKEDFQTMKGFRDFIAPFFDVPIVYDNFELVKNAYGNIMPYYEYGSFKNLIELANELKENSLLRTNYVNQQKEFAINNTIDKQLHNVIQ